MIVTVIVMEAGTTDCTEMKKGEPCLPHLQLEGQEMKMVRVGSVVGGSDGWHRSNQSHSRSRSDSRSRSRTRTPTKKELKEAHKKHEKELILEAERSKAKINQPTGKGIEHHYRLTCDDEFFYLSSHVDKTIRDKIRNGEVDIDLSRLILKCKLSNDNKLEIINKEGHSYFVPTSDREIPMINSFKRLEQAFRIFSGIYTKTRPDRVQQLYQYVDAISTAAENFVWDNVYTYDQLFHQLITEYPHRSWGIIYTHGWNMILNDHLPK